MDDFSVHPDVRAGDAFAYVGGADPGQERPCFYCLEGWVFLGCLDHDGEEVVESFRCRKCGGSGTLGKPRADEEGEVVAENGLSLEEILEERRRGR